MAIGNAVDATQSGFQSLTTAGVWNGRTFTAGEGISITNGDGVSGNPTISSTGSFSGLGQVVIFDDFLGQAGDNNAGNANLTAFGINSTITPIAGTAQNPGIIGITTQSSNGYRFLLGNNINLNSGDFVLGSGEISFTAIINIPTLPDGTNRFIIYCGLGSLSIPGAPSTLADGCWFSYVDNVNSGKWLINTKGNSGTTSLDSGVAGGTGFNTFKVVVNAAATSVSFYINGTQTSNSPIATNIPTDGITFFIAIEKTLGSSNRTLQVDLINFNYTMTTPRVG